MAYDLRGSSGLRSVRGRSGLRESGEVDPMSSVANIVDAMLVLCVGLMVAIIAFWNLDMSQIQEVAAQNEMTEVNDIEKMVEQAQNGGGYDELGVVYQDPATGKMYMLTQDVDKGASAVGNAASKDD